jgi:hypothetical protein
MLKGFQKPGRRDVAVDVDDVLLLKSLGIRCDPEDVVDWHLMLAAENWLVQNQHYDFAACRWCGAETMQPHELDCSHGARMETDRRRL